jgi:hypothetical protein
MFKLILPLWSIENVLELEPWIHQQPWEISKLLPVLPLLLLGFSWRFSGYFLRIPLNHIGAMAFLGALFFWKNLESQPTGPASILVPWVGRGTLVHSFA